MSRILGKLAEPHVSVPTAVVVALVTWMEFRYTPPNLGILSQQLTGSVNTLNKAIDGNAGKIEDNREDLREIRGLIYRIPGVAGGSPMTVEITPAAVANQRYEATKAAAIQQLDAAWSQGSLMTAEKAHEGNEQTLLRLKEAAARGLDMPACIEEELAYWGKFREEGEFDPRRIPKPDYLGGDDEQEGDTNGA